MSSDQMRIYRILRILVVVGIIGMLLASCTGAADPASSSTGSVDTNPLVRIVLIFLVFLAFVLLLALPLLQSSLGEFVAGIAVVVILILYYAQPIREWVVQFATEGPLAGKGVVDVLVKVFSLPLSAQTSVLEHLPQKIVSIGELTLLRFTAKPEFDTTMVPLIMVILGVGTRLAVANWVRNERLSRLTGEYWLYVLVYLLLAYVISAVTKWSFVAVALLFLLIFLALALGLLEIIRDLLRGVWHVFVLLWRFLRIVGKGIVSLVTVITEFLRSIGASIKRLYHRFVVEPVSRLYEWISGWLNEIEQRLDAFLGRPPK